MFKKIFASLFVVACVGALLYFGASQTTSTISYEVRAAMDVGSGSTNLKVAEVDPATNRVIRVLYEEAVRVPYQNQLEKSSTGMFDEQIMGLGMKAMKDLKEKALMHGAKKIVAVATAAFRNAKNAPEFAEMIHQQTGIDIYIIDQKKEGELAFKAALAKGDHDEKNVVVWDIGGGSFQLTAVDSNHQMIVSRGHFASEPFKKFIITMIQSKDVNETLSPNPMSKEEIDQALTKSMQVAQETDPFIMQKLKSGDAKVLAVGDLFNFGIRGIADNKTVITPEDLQKAIDTMQGKDDDTLGGSYADVRMSNALLVLGFMKELHIKQVEVLDLNNADGVLATPGYWVEEL